MQQNGRGSKVSEMDTTVQERLRSAFSDEEWMFLQGNKQFVDALAAANELAHFRSVCLLGDRLIKERAGQRDQTRTCNPGTLEC